MTTATTIRVPVRTWQEKAILAAAIGAPLRYIETNHDAFELGETYVHLLAEVATDGLIDEYFHKLPEGSVDVRAIEHALRSLRAMAPGPDAVLEIPADLGLLKMLDEQIADLVSLDVEGLMPHVEHPDRRTMAEATLVAIDLRDELVRRGA
jgi:hypothetical protein